VAVRATWSFRRLMKKPNLVVLAVKVTLALALGGAWFGVLLPYLISSSSDLLVITGILTTVFGVVFSVLSLSRDIIAAHMLYKRVKH